MLEDLPEKIKDRESKILDIIQNYPERITHNWYPIIAPEATYVVSAQPIRIDGILITLSASAQTEVAKLWDCTLLTAKLVDLIHQHADIVIEPCPRLISSTKSAMILHSQNVDKQLEKYDTTNKLASTIGKMWINNLSAPAGKATIYGWHINTNQLNWKGIKLFPSETLQNSKVIQPVSTIHNMFHNDYSMCPRFISRIIIKDEIYKASEVMFEPEFKHLFF
jgi:hypothetical protein